MDQIKKIIHSIYLSSKSSFLFLRQNLYTNAKYCDLPNINMTDNNIWVPKITGSTFDQSIGIVDVFPSAYMRYLHFTDQCKYPRQCQLIFPYQYDITIFVLWSQFQLQQSRSNNIGYSKSILLMYILMIHTDRLMMMALSIFSKNQFSWRIKSIPFKNLIKCKHTNNNLCKIIHEGRTSTSFNLQQLFCYPLL